MPRKAGSTNKGQRLEHQLLAHGKHQWRYRGKLFPDRLEIHKISGELASHVVELDAAIKRECKRLGVTVELKDEDAAALMLKHIAVAA